MKRVYFIKPIGMDGPIKIGCSQSPDNRRETLQAWCPFPLEIVAEIEGSFDLELRFHEAFAEAWKGREWFDATPELIATIADINAGNFMVASLPSKNLNKGKFRRPKDQSYMTDAFRYRLSVEGRLRRRRHLRSQISEALGVGLYSRHATPEKYEERRSQIEAVFRADGALVKAAAA